MRGYTNYNAGRRALAQPMHDGLTPIVANAPPGSVQLASDGSMAALVPASRALSWQMTGPDGAPVVRERYWVSFAPGEMRTCTNCHGINQVDVVLGLPKPTNPPQALHTLAAWYRDTLKNLTLTLTPASATFTASGGTSAVNLNPANVANWPVSTRAGWITIISSDGAAVNYSVAANPGSIARSAIITIGDQSLSVRQGANFNDVPASHPLYTYIEKLSALGITGGCGQGNFCPNASVTREQMAIFIERALGVFTPPTPAHQTFADVLPSRIGYAFIEDFAQRGITSGCGGGNYCPDAAVTRAQMAVFLVKAFGL